MEDTGKVMGVDFSEFESCWKTQPVKGLLYYKKSILTDKHYIKNVYTYDGKYYVNKGEHLIYTFGETKSGDYLTTCDLYGVAMVTDNPELAFAKVTVGRAPDTDVHFSVIGGCYAEFL